MAKTTMTTTIVTRKQQVSKILQGQLLADLRRRIKGTDDPRRAARESWLYQLLNQSKLGRLGGVGVDDDFQIRFEYLNRGALKIVYCNNQGLISATFDRTEVSCAVQLLKRKASALVKAEVEVAERRLEKQHKERWQETLGCLSRDLGVAELREQLEKLQSDYDHLEKLHQELEEAVMNSHKPAETCAARPRVVKSATEIREDDDEYI